MARDLDGMGLMTQVKRGDDARNKRPNPAVQKQQ